jgi:hypothetical protein
MQGHLFPSNDTTFLPSGDTSHASSRISATKTPHFSGLFESVAMILCFGLGGYKETQFARHCLHLM